MKRTIKDIEEILKKAKAALQKIYGKRLKGVILYGSYARGEAVEGSDIDLIVLLDNMENPVDELEKCSKQIHQLDFAYDTLIPIFLKTLCGNRCFWKGFYQNKDISPENARFTCFSF